MTPIGHHHGPPSYMCAGHLLTSPVLPGPKSDGPDRCTWLDANGLTMKTWLLNDDEQLIDAGVAGDQMVVLVRTNAQDLRMIRFNLGQRSAFRIGHLDPSGYWLIGS